MTDKKELENRIAELIVPWNEEIQGEKFAAMDAHSMAREILDEVVWPLIERFNGCTGYFNDHGDLCHDRDTCSLHESKY